MGRHSPPWSSERHCSPFNPAPKGGYLAFLGRISPEKRPDRAIEIAIHTGAKLKIAAKIDKVDQDYWTNVIEPMVASSPNVEYIGEIGEKDKAEFLGNADALLFPIDWPEPFGLVMIEAMSCGTPVIAFRRGSAAEVIDDGVSGYLVEDVLQAVAAVRRIPELDRARVRDTFDRRFDIRRVARQYVQVYRTLATAEEARSPRTATERFCAVTTFSGPHAPISLFCSNLGQKSPTRRRRSKAEKRRSATRNDADRIVLIEHVDDHVAIGSA